MKKLLILLIGLSGCTPTITNSYTKVCEYGIEYLIAVDGVTVMYDKDGKPKQCNY